MLFNSLGRGKITGVECLRRRINTGIDRFTLNLSCLEFRIPLFRRAGKKMFACFLLTFAFGTFFTLSDQTQTKFLADKRSIKNNRPVIGK